MHTALFLGEGQIFGELSLLDQGPRTATVIADEDPTVVYTLRRDAFESLCRSDIALGYQLMRNIALDLAFKLRHHNLDN
jgi:CRP-like cAMP-binding protein